MENTRKNTSQDFKIKGNWDQQSIQLKGKYNQLTDEDLKVESGKENEMLTRLGNRLNINRNEVINIINKEQSKSV